MAIVETVMRYWYCLNIKDTSRRSMSTTMMQLSGNVDVYFGVRGLTIVGEFSQICAFRSEIMRPIIVTELRAN